MEADEEDEEEMKLILVCTLHKRRQDSRRCYDERLRRWQPEEYHKEKDEREHLVESPNRNARNK